MGGAIGDALGASVEFMSRAEILARHGPEGIVRFEHGYGRRGAITDDTQMTLFTAEGLLQAMSRRRSGIDEPPESVVHRAYLRWLRTQHLSDRWSSSGQDRSGWLIGVPTLHSRRAPGHTCVGALETGRMGTPTEPLNGSKGCGGVMRIAPCALVKDWDPFDVACKVAATTHGHPTGYLAAGALAVIIRSMLEEKDVAQGVLAAIARLESEPGADECIGALKKAIALWNADERDGDVEELGQGWVAEEALAIGVYCAMVGERDVRKGLTMAVTHSGDSDSTGAIAGNILGAKLGDLPFSLSEYDDVELRDEILVLADDLLDAWLDGDEWRRRYAGELSDRRPADLL